MKIKFRRIFLCHFNILFFTEFVHILHRKCDIEKKRWLNLISNELRKWIKFTSLHAQKYKSMKSFTLNAARTTQKRTHQMKCTHEVNKRRCNYSLCIFTLAVDSTMARVWRKKLRYKSVAELEVQFYCSVHCTFFAHSSCWKCRKTINTLPKRKHVSVGDFYGVHCWWRIFPCSTEAKKLPHV